MSDKSLESEVWENYSTGYILDSDENKFTFDEVDAMINRAKTVACIE